MKNQGFSELIDTTFYCTLKIRDVYRTGSKITNDFRIPCSYSNSLRFGSNNRIVALKLHETKFELWLKKPYFVKNLVIARPTVGLRFEDFFMCYDDAWFELTLVGHDRRTGIKKIYQSPRYRFWTIRAGAWDKENKMKLKVDFSSKFS
jgi:hypothetical protein